MGEGNCKVGAGYGARKYIRKPETTTEITAIQFLPKMDGCLEMVLEFCGTKIYYPDDSGIRIVLTNGEENLLNPGDFVINSGGELYPCPKEIFNNKFMVDQPQGE